MRGAIQKLEYPEIVQHLLVENIFKLVIAASLPGCVITANKAVYRLHYLRVLTRVHGNTGCSSARRARPQAFTRSRNKEMVDSLPCDGQVVSIIELTSLASPPTKALF